jgi:hypothetical protein
MTPSLETYVRASPNPLRANMCYTSLSYPLFRPGLCPHNTMTVLRTSPAASSALLSSQDFLALLFSNRGQVYMYDLIPSPRQRKREEERYMLFIQPSCVTYFLMIQGWGSMSVLLTIESSARYFSSEQTHYDQRVMCPNLQEHLHSV